MTRPRLLVVASTFPARADDGTPAFVQDLALAESEQFETVVLVPAVPGALPREQIGAMRVVRFRYFFRQWEDLADGAIIENIRSRRSRLLQVVPFLAAESVAIRRLIVRFRPDVMHVHWIAPQGVAALPVMSRIPTLVTTHGGDLYALRDPVSRRLKSAVVRRATALTTVNADMRDKLIELGANPDSTHVLPMGADLDAIRAASSVAERVPGRMLFVGRLVEKKGLGVLLQALRGLGGGWSLHVVGDGPLRAELTSSTANLPVTFLGQLGRKAVAAEYGSAEIAVVPSVRAESGDQDGLPVAMLEAMGAGCAVVASDLPGINTAVRHDETGLLVPPGDAAVLAHTLAALLANCTLRARLGSAASAHADSYSMRGIGAQYRDLLSQISR